MNIKSPNGNVGVVIGRFQVHKLHPGHKEILDWVYRKYSQMIVVLGQSPVIGSRNNPLPFTARSKMIMDNYPNAIVATVTDCRSDEEWSNRVDIAIRNCIGPHQKPVLFGSRDSFIPHYHGKYETQELQGNPENFWSGTKTREFISESIMKFNSLDFRAGVIYGAYANYPRVIPTIDVAVFMDDYLETVAFVRKNGENKLRFCGGYAEPGGTYEGDAYREVKEEIGDLELSNFAYIGSFDIDDWRYQSDIDKIRTVFFATRKVWGYTKTKDTQEIAEVVIKNLTTVLDDDIMPEHVPLLRALKEWKQKGNIV